jgi:hypothetical protein
MQRCAIGACVYGSEVAWSKARSGYELELGFVDLVDSVHGMQ